MWGGWIERRQRKKFRADGERRESALERESTSLPLSRNAMRGHEDVVQSRNDIDLEGKHRNEEGLWTFSRKKESWEDAIYTMKQMSIV